MWISIISAFVCFAITVTLFLPKFMNISICRPIAGYFFFEGVWTLVNYIMLQINPSSAIPQYIHYIGTIVFGGYLLVYLLFSSKRTVEKKRSNSTEIDI